VLKTLGGWEDGAGSESAFFEGREQNATWRLEGVSRAEMARRLGRSSSTVNRELAHDAVGEAAIAVSEDDRTQRCRVVALDRQHDAIGALIDQAVRGLAAGQRRFRCSRERGGRQQGEQRRSGRDRSRHRKPFGQPLSSPHAHRSALQDGCSRCKWRLWG
jgi:hypothetical protein